MLKEEFKEIYSVQAPMLSKLVLWCLENEYKDRPDFIDLESEINKIESELINERNFSKLESPQNEEEIIFKRSQLEMKNLIIDNNASMNFGFSKVSTSPTNELSSFKKKLQKMQIDNFQTFSENHTEEEKNSISYR